MKDQTTERDNKSERDEQAQPLGETQEDSNLIFTKNAKPVSKRQRRYFVARFMAVSSILLVTLFLITYSGYLIAVQYLLSIANKYNMVLLNNNTVYVDVDLAKFKFYGQCTMTQLTVTCLTEYLGSFKEKGVDNLILNNLLDKNFEFQENTATADAFKELIRVSEELDIGIYINIDRKTSESTAYREIQGDKYGRNLTLVFYDHINDTCIDTYKEALKSAIKTYAWLDVDGFVINDLPCCFFYSNYSENGTCTFDSIKELKSLARKEGKPSALIFRPSFNNSQTLLELLGLFNYTHFDGVIRDLKVNKLGQIVYTKLPSPSVLTNLHEIWTFDFERQLLPQESEQNMKLYYSIVSFIRGSVLYNLNYTDMRTTSVDSDQALSNEVNGDLRMLEIISQIKKAIRESSCECDPNSFTPDYANDGVFLAITTLNDETSSHCVLLINFGETRTEVNMKAHLSNYETRPATALIVFTVDASGLTVNNSTKSYKTITLEPHSGMLLQVQRKDSP